VHRDRQSQDLTLPCKGVGWAVKVLCVAVRRNGCQAKSGMALRSWASVAVGMLALHQAWRATSAHTIRARKQRKMSSSQAHAPARPKLGVRSRAATRSSSRATAPASRTSFWTAGGRSAAPGGKRRASKPSESVSVLRRAATSVSGYGGVSLEAGSENERRLRGANAPSGAWLAGAGCGALEHWVRGAARPRTREGVARTP